MIRSKGFWRLKGLDTFEGEMYSLPGKYRTQGEAEAAARQRLVELEESQPTESSGGQGTLGIQDRVFVVRPDGKKYRIFPEPFQENGVLLEMADLEKLFYDYHRRCKLRVSHKKSDYEAAVATERLVEVLTRMVHEEMPKLISDKAYKEALETEATDVVTRVVNTLLDMARLWTPNEVRGKMFREYLPDMTFEEWVRGKMFREYLPDMTFEEWVRYFAQGVMEQFFDKKDFRRHRSIDD